MTRPVIVRTNGPHADEYSIETFEDLPGFPDLVRTKLVLGNTDGHGHDEIDHVVTSVPDHPGNTMTDTTTYVMSEQPVVETERYQSPVFLGSQISAMARNASHTEIVVTQRQ